MSKLCFISVAALVATAGVASAAKDVANNSVLWNENGSVGLKDLPNSSERQGQTFTVPVAGIESRDGLGAAGNIRLQFNLGAGAIVNGIQWDGIVLTAEGASWISELGVALVQNGGSGGINLRPGAGAANNVPGQGGPFSSGGMIKFSSVPLPDVVLGADGILTLEFFESFDDQAGVRDGIWKTGSLTIQYVPTPGAVSLFGLAGLAAARRRRA